MKTTTFTIAMSFMLFSCQTEAGKKATEERIKAERQADSVRKVTKELKRFLDCQIDLMIAGADEKEACEKCRSIYYEGFVYDSINEAKKNIKKP